MTDEIVRKLQEPFPANEIEWRIGSKNADGTKGMALAYVTNRAIQNRLDEVFGVFGWQNQFTQWNGKAQLCGISAYDTTACTWLTKWDGADNTDFEATKGGLSDSMKRAAVQWGIGRYLYNLDAVWVPIKKVSEKTFIIEKENIPKLPAWALPKVTQPEPPISQPPKPKLQKEPEKTKMDELAEKVYANAEQVEAIRKICRVKWGDGAPEAFTRVTQILKPKYVEAHKYDAVMKKLNEAI